MMFGVGVGVGVVDVVSDVVVDVFVEVDLVLRVFGWYVVSVVSEMVRMMVSVV